MRAFLAIPIPHELQQPLAVAGQAFTDMRCVRADNLHLTLKFLGDVRDPVPVAEAAEEVCASHQPFDVTLARVGCFPQRKKARVVWVGLEEGDLAAGALAIGLERALEPLGFPPEGRPWRGHVTLGRFKTPKRLRASLLDREHVFGTFRAEEVVLFRSELTPDGAIHTPIHRLPLGG
ncbi:MAG: RNA 2',3'-cyclic phosphodiesterase [Planctomycetota bacterium]|jgi:2'-5' RNA ligase